MTRDTVLEAIARRRDDANACPFCCAEGTVSLGETFEFPDGGESYADAACGACGIAWREYYKFTDLEIKDSKGICIPLEEM